VRRLILLITVAAACVAGAASCAVAQDYPARPVRLVVGFPPGGVADVLARMMAIKLSEYWAQPVVVENRVGAGGIIAADVVARASPDGYTLSIGDIGPNAMAATLQKRLPYDPMLESLCSSKFHCSSSYAIPHRSPQSRS
jgi:tripartite-type tricarboxylate transporter receptor subunit TctC